MNFVPVQSPELQQNVALVALGETLPIFKYTTLRDGNFAVLSSNSDGEAQATEKDGSRVSIQEQVYLNRISRMSKCIICVSHIV